MGHAIIHLHPAAPAKPATGAACNGCGVCCAWQPCPLGMLVSGRRHGSCTALRWDDQAALYRCAMVDAPEAAWPALPRLLRPALVRLARRWIAAGAGCDCDAEARPADGPQGRAAPGPPPAGA
jgi:hypothetical protein